MASSIRSDSISTSWAKNNPASGQLDPVSIGNPSIFSPQPSPTALVARFYIVALIGSVLPRPNLPANYGGLDTQTWILCPHSSLFEQWSVHSEYERLCQVRSPHGFLTQEMLTCRTLNLCLILNLSTANHSVERKTSRFLWVHSCVDIIYYHHQTTFLRTGTSRR